MATNESYSRGMIKYSSRDYDSLMEEFWNIVPKLTDLWKPEADADPGVVLGKIIASTADMLGVNTDWLANELFAPTVSQRKNAEKIFGLIGYDLGWFTAAKTEVTFTNVRTENSIKIDFGFNGGNFATLNAYTDITNQARTLTYNVIPQTTASMVRSTRNMITPYTNAFASSDIVELAPGESVTRVAIEGELRSYSVTIKQVKDNNYMIRLPSQHIDTTAIWVKSKSSSGEDIDTQWVQCASPSEFIQPEPRFAVTYDNYSNAQVQISNYINQLESYESNSLVIYWIDCSGVIGSVGTDVLSNLMLAKSISADVSVENDIAISNLSNTIELPNTNVVTGKSPETAKEAYRNSRNFINTWDSLITLPDFNRFLNREPGVNCGVVIDCQKALDINLAIYNDKNLTDAQKSKQYISNRDFPAGEPIYNWASALNLDFDPSDPQKFVFSTNFKTYTAMCFAIHNNFKESNWGRGQTAIPQTNNKGVFMQYKPPIQFVQNVIKDYRPLQAMSVEVQFGYARIFNFYVVGMITPVRPVSSSVADILIAEVKEALALYFHPDNREFGQKPTLMEIVDVVENADPKIRHFDPGSAKTNGIVWNNCDIEWFNPISFARYIDDMSSTTNIRVNPEYITD